LFVEYFELSETKSGNVYQDGILQFSEKQRDIKNKLEKQLSYLSQESHVDELCIIDMFGQEHGRLVFSLKQPDDALSNEEASAPFFVPTFEKDNGVVHVQYPYLSPDTYRQVFSYSSPIVLGDDSRPAFLHFEISVETFRNLLETEIGAYYIIDPTNTIIADSNIRENQITFFPSIPESFASYDELIEENPTRLTYVRDGVDYFAVYKELPNFDWILLYEQPSSSILIGNSSLDEFRNISVLIVSIVAIFGFFMVTLFSSKISKPLQNLAEAAVNIKHGNKHEYTLISGSDEMKTLSSSFNTMVKSLENKIFLEEELVKIKNDQLKNEQLTTIGKLASNLAHDIRNPLAVIKGTLDVMRATSNFDDSTNEKFDRVDSSISRISHQVNNVLDYVKQRKLNLEKLPIRQILDETIVDISVPSSVKISIIQQDPDCMIKCDVEGMKIVFINLIVNAISAMNDRGNITIEIHNDTDLTIIIANTGPNIPEDHLEDIFEPLFTTKQEGTGLGLASCKTIVEQHDGKIVAFTNPTKFVITLPNT